LGNSCLGAQEPARFGKATAIAAPLFPPELSAKLRGARRCVKASGGRWWRTQGEPWISVAAGERAEASAADDAVNPANLSAASSVGGPVAARSTAKPLELIAADVVVRRVE
jgi:hypothetical protein